MNIVLRKISHIPSRVRSTCRQAKYVIDGLVQASRDAWLISRRLRNTCVEAEQVQGVAVVNAGRSLQVTDIELYMAHVLARNGLTVYVLLDDGVLEHWDSSQMHSFKYYSPYRAHWCVRWRHEIRKRLVCVAYRRRGMRLVSYSSIMSRVKPSEVLEESDFEYATSSTERFYGTSMVEVSGVHGDYYRKSLRNCATSRAVAAYALEALRPDLYVTSHGIYSVWGPAYRLMKGAGVPVVVWQAVGTTTGKIRLVDRHDGVLATAGDWQQSCAATASDPNVIQDGKALIEARLARRSHDTAEYFGPGFEKSRLSALARDAGVRFGMFPNVVWDGNIPERNIMFENVVEWCVYTINAIRGTRHHLYIRFHPAETTRHKGTAKMENIVRSRIPDVDSLDNVTLISSDQPVDTYEFVKTHVDVGLVYDGQLCFELTFMGIPVIACANGNYTPDTVVYKPQSRDEYRAHLMDPTGILDRFEGEREERAAQACRFAYWLFDESLLDFQPLENPYPVRINYALVGRDEPLSADEQRISERSIEPLRRKRSGGAQC